MCKSPGEASAASRSETVRANARQSWASKNLLALGKTEARRRAKLRQKELALGGFEPAPELSVWLREQNVLTGFFAGHPEWSEASFTDKPLEVPSAFPRLSDEPAHEMTFRLAKASDLKLAPRWELREPPATLPVCEPKVVLASCLLASLTGERMGRGKGHYDRYLSRHPNMRVVGVLHSDFLVEQFPADWIEDHDVDMNFLVTERVFFPAFPPLQTKGDI